MRQRVVIVVQLCDDDGLSYAVPLLCLRSSHLQERHVESDCGVDTREPYASKKYRSSVDFVELTMVTTSLVVEL